MADLAVTIYKYFPPLLFSCFLLFIFLQSNKDVWLQRAPIGIKFLRHSIALWREMEEVMRTGMGRRFVRNNFRIDQSRKGGRGTPEQDMLVSGDDVQHQSQSAWKP